MAQPPRIKVRGAGSIPQGFVLGRSSKGSGDVQLMDMRRLRGLGIGGGAAAAPPSPSSGGPPFHPGFQPNRFYTIPFVNASASGGVAANIIYAVPFYVPVATTFTKINVGVAVAAAAGKLCRLGIFANLNGIPGALEYDCGTTSIATTGTAGAVGFTGQVLALTAGWHWLAYVSDGAPTINIGNQVGVVSWLLGSAGLGGTGDFITAAFTFAPFPSTFPTAAYTAGNFPLIYLRL